MSEHGTRRSGDCAVIDVAGAYGRATFLQLQDVARAAVQAGAKRVLLNMARLPHINSEGIGLLVLVHDECEKGGARMGLCAVPRRVEHVLRLAGVVNFFRTFPDEATGLAALAGGAAPPSSEAPGEPELTVVATLKGPGPPAGPPAPAVQAAPGRPADLAEAARDVVRTMLRSRRHHEVLEFFGRRPLKIASLDEISAAIGVPRPAAETVMRDLARSGVVVEDGEIFAWRPSPEAEAKIRLFRQALAEPRLRSRVLAWLYAEEKK